ncbi:MAG TPA: hypothetical protein V6D50_14310 [Chroococcales cyanobacterium]|jgi:hypothetical protein
MPQTLDRQPGELYIQVPNHQRIAFPLKQAEGQIRVTGNVSRVRLETIVQQALITGYLTVEAENELRRLLQCKLSADELKAFWTLQNAAMMGCVKQESRELGRISRTC